MVKMEVSTMNLKKMLLRLMIVMLVLKSADCRQPVLHRVGGGRFTWRPNVNFTGWASHEKFYVGDWLYFGFDRTRYNVLEVNKTSYDHCIDKNFIANITRGGRDVYNLTEARPYYFLSSHVYCFQGMKVAISVQYAPPDPAPLVFASGSPSRTSYDLVIILLPLLIGSAIAAPSLFKLVQ